MNPDKPVTVKDLRDSLGTNNRKRTMTGNPATSML